MHANQSPPSIARQVPGRVRLRRARGLRRVRSKTPRGFSDIYHPRSPGGCGRHEVQSSISSGVFARQGRLCRLGIGWEPIHSRSNQRPLAIGFTDGIASSIADAGMAGLATTCHALISIHKVIWRGSRHCCPPPGPSSWPKLLTLPSGQLNMLQVSMPISGRGVPIHAPCPAPPAMPGLRHCLIHNIVGRG